jgi:hypothetical protein
MTDIASELTGLPIPVGEMTVTQKLELAKAMVKPIRCGGLDYRPDGTPVYRDGRNGIISDILWHQKMQGSHQAG